jgi:Bax protein
VKFIDANRLAGFLILFALAAAATPLANPAFAAQGNSAPAAADAQSGPEVIVFAGLEELMSWMEQEDWWGEEKRGEQLTVPHLIITAINPSWQQASKKLTVQQKKELFYRLMLPLVMHANEMVIEFREGLLATKEQLDGEGKVSPDSLALLRRLSFVLPGIEEEDAGALRADSPELDDMIDELLYRVDVVPAGLALGQAAYESGYGTSRFAVQGNSLFGQWTYKGDGIVPGQQRKSLGNHQIKAFDWPFDSVRGYFINLMSHRAYEDFRKIRARLREAGEPLDSLVLADGLVKYSERGQDYVDSLKGMIRYNGLDRADDAVFRDEPLRFLLNEGTPEEATQTRKEIERMRASGELQEIVARMRLE